MQISRSDINNIQLNICYISTTVVRTYVSTSSECEMCDLCDDSLCKMYAVILASKTDFVQCKDER